MAAVEIVDPARIRFKLREVWPDFMTFYGTPATWAGWNVCGDDTLFDEFIDYPVSVLSWATTKGNPGLTEVCDRSGRAVPGGLPAKPEIGKVSAAELVALAHAAIAATGARHHLLGPGCSINPDTPEALMHAVGAAVAA